MAETFEDLGIAPGLARGAAGLGWNTPTPLQRDAIPVIRRGNNVILNAASGAGITGAFGLGVLDRIASGDAGDGAPLVLVVVPDADAAARTAAALARLAAPAGITVRAETAGWPERDAAVLVASPGAAMAAVRGSALKLDGLIAVVVEAADVIAATGGGSDLETLLASAPQGAQRVVATATFPEEVDRFIEGHVRRAMTVPPRPDEDPGAGTGTTGSVGYAVVPARGKLDAVVSLIGGADAAEVAVVSRTAERAGSVAAALADRGVAVANDGPAPETGAGARVLSLPFGEADRRSTRATVLSHDVPFDAAALAELHGAGGVVLVTPAELAHLKTIARRARLAIQPTPLPRARALDRVEAARGRLRAALRDADLTPHLAVIEPLLAEHSAAEIAAAALSLAAERGGQPAGGAGPAAPAAAAERATAPGAPPPSTAWVRIFVTAGSRDDVGPGDVLGAITGEAGVQGDAIGRIDIRESHTTVEVPTELADRIIRALNGRTLKGRSIRVDYDRKERGRESRSPARGPARRPTRGRGGRGPASRS